MKKTSLLSTFVIAGMLTCSTVPLCAFPQQSSPAQSESSTAPAQSNSQGSNESAPAHSWTMEQAVTSTVRQAWALGGKTPEGFFEIVKALAQLSAQNRGITLPENQEAGRRTGEWIKKEAKKDPDQLLYAIVDRAVQHNAKVNAAAGQQ